MIYTTQGGTITGGTVQQTEYQLSGGTGSVNQADLALQQNLRPGSVWPLSILRGSWGLPSGSSSRTQGVLLERRNTPASAWFAVSWMNPFSLNSSGTVSDVEYRWRAPIPHTGYLRIEWEHLRIEEGTIGNTAHADSLVIDDCYRNVFATLAADPFSHSLYPWVGGAFSEFNQRPRMSPTTESRRIAGSEYAMAYDGHIDVEVTATPIKLRAVVRPPSNGEFLRIGGVYPLTFTPSTGASARAVMRSLYGQVPSVSGGAQDFIAGAILDAAGAAVTTRHTSIIESASGVSVNFIPKYTGGETSGITVTRGSPVHLDSGRAMLIPSDWTGADPFQGGQLARVIFGGDTVSYSPLKTHVFTEADKPGDYHPFIPATWPASPAFMLSAQDEGTRVLEITLPRFFYTP